MVRVHSGCGYGYMRHWHAHEATHAEDQLNKVESFRRWYCHEHRDKQHRSGLQFVTWAKIGEPYDLHDRCLEAYDL